MATMTKAKTIDTAPHPTHVIPVVTPTAADATASPTSAAVVASSRFETSSRRNAKGREDVMKSNEVSRLREALKESQRDAKQTGAALQNLLAGSPGCPNAFAASYGRQGQ